MTEQGEGDDTGTATGLPSSSPAPRRRLGLRREGLILLPVSMLALIAVSFFTLVSYRSAISRLIDEAHEQTLRRAQRLASTIGQPGNLAFDAAQLRSHAPDAQGIALLDDSGLPLVEAGSFPEGNLLRSLREPPLRSLETFGPDRETGDAVVALVPMAEGGPASILRLDLPAPTLATQSRSLPILTVVVLTVDGGLMLLLLLFLRHWLEPFESMLQRARELSRDDPSMEPDEVAFLVSTFDRALSAMTEDHAGSVEDDIQALQRTLASSLESGLLLLDPEGHSLALNGVGAELLGLDPPPAGTPIEDLLLDQPQLLQTLQQVIGTGRAVNRQESVVQLEDRTLTLGLTVHPLRRPGGEPRGWLVLFADLTQAQRQARERRLAESLGQIGELAAGVAHELRNSLASLRGYLTLIERKPDESEVGEYLVEMRHEADHLQRVLEDFLTFARPGSVRLEELDLRRLVGRAAADPSLSLLGVGIEVRGEGVDLPVLGDPQLLERAFRNLLHNAARAQLAGEHPEESVRVQVLRSETGETFDQRAVVWIDDTGGGIPDELAERLFVPFASAAVDGVGLGLALSLRILELHGGRLRLDNRQPAGARATVEIPLAGARDSPSADHNSGSIATEGNDFDPRRPADPGRPESR